MRLLAGLTLLALTVLLLGVEFPSSIDTPGKVMAAQEWLVVKGPDGRLESALRDYATGRIHSYRVRQVERGEEARFELHPGLIPGAWVEEGDTLGWFYSSQEERQRAQLQTELASAAASLELARAGEKEAVVREARQRLALAQAQLAQQQRQAARLQALFDQQMAAAEEVETAQHAATLYALQVEVAQAQVEVVATGDREARIEVARARLEGLQRESEVLAKRQQAAILLTPLAGRVYSALAADTLVVVRDLSRFALLLPVKWRDRDLVAPGQAVELHTDRGLLPGVIGHLDLALRLLEGEQVFFAAALVEDTGQRLAPGLLVNCSIPCAPVGLLDYLKRFFTG